ncbi:hypothetical protein [Amycolatopsis regifaucium]|uniref:Uncharacterized protein n=1 Tax=Amycolatopsis regifaucium TaxID=546365 RepID=A0A154M4Z7_9PSEU|nr:hypothetical protein [Amycolatopsis regifaucium]KZB79636.1 hypothetical protein AVL48_14565 [Amycolatopsis regifaucium]OKA10047.1 hypothetical protein ATP06_0206850 [Amycolatopsis regifaucium]SFI63532.1 Myb/SANT-like DNA-binding domain-containing protein [Amycolatopsis regifaucium]
MSTDAMSWPGPVDGAPYTEQSLTALRLARAAVEAADAAAGIIPTGPPGRNRVPGLGLSDALIFMGRARDVLDAAVLTERVHGTGWDVIAETITADTGEQITAEQAENRWGHLETEWESAQRLASFPGRKDIVGIPDELLDPHYWITRRREEPDGPGPGLVSDRMRRMDAFAELAHQSRLRDQLRADNLAPTPALLAPIYEREALLADAMADAGHENYRDLAAKARTRAADARARTTRTGKDSHDA